MTPAPNKGYRALRVGRWSEPGSEYFITLCTIQRKEARLESPDLRAAILHQFRTMESESIWHIRTAVIMPDHVHILVVLGESTELSASVRLLKGRLAPALRARGVHWERGYFDHRTRADEDRWPVFLYIFLNPYREGLIQAGQSWNGYYCSREDWAWFGELTNRPCPFPEWLE